MRRLILSFLGVALLLLTSCNAKSAYDNIVPIWCNGSVKGECVEATYIANVYFADDKLTFRIVEPAIISGLVFIVDNDSVVLVNDDLSLEYNNNDIRGFLTDFYNSVKCLENQNIIYNINGDIYTSEFTSDNNQFRIVLDKKTKKVMSFETPECVYTINEEVT